MAKMKAGIKAVIAFMVIACGVVALHQLYQQTMSDGNSGLGQSKTTLPSPTTAATATPFPASEPQATSYTARDMFKKEKRWLTMENNRFIPSEIRVSSGAQVELTVVANRDSGIAIYEHEVSQPLSAGKPETIEFIAGRRGAYPIRCSEHCGVGKEMVIGTLVVEE